MNKCYFCEKIYDTKTLKNMSQEDRKKLCQQEWELYCVITHNTEKFGRNCVHAIEDYMKSYGFNYIPKYSIEFERCDI